MSASRFEDEILRCASEVLGGVATPSQKPIQGLWGGMGKVLRYSCCDRSLVVKFVNPPRHALDSESVTDKEFRSLLRKLVSFHVEGSFYSDIAPVIKSYDALLSSTGGLVDFCCRMPDCWKVISKTIVSDENDYGRHASQHAFFFEDLAAAGYSSPRHPIGGELEVRDCLSWLAAFHARSIKYLRENSGCYTATDTYSFEASQWSMGCERDVKKSRAGGCGELISLGGTDLWRSGSYWHVGTRPDELESIVGSKDKTIKNLAQNAHVVSDRLSVDQLRFPCLVHGDPKIANFCFPSRSDYESKVNSRVAALDFQYVGLGCGMRDVAYYLGGFNGYSINSKTLQLYLDFYFNMLKKNLELLLPHHHPLLGEQIEMEWRPLYSFAAADLTRFMCGWSGPYLDDADRVVVENVLATLK